MKIIFKFKHEMGDKLWQKANEKMKFKFTILLFLNER